MSGKNVLILCSDEHAPSALGCYGHPIVRTPVLDRLAAKGTRFTNAYTPSPICVSARACLATGTHVHENGCWSSSQPFYGHRESWMSRLRETGHTVVSIGKLHFRSGRDDNGFSEEIAPMYLANDGRGWPLSLIRNPSADFEETDELARDAGPGDSTYTDYDRRITDETCQWLKDRSSAPGEKPWVLFVSFVSPHYPLTAPREFYDLYADKEMPGTIPASFDHPVLNDLAKFWDYETHFDDEKRDRAKKGYFGLCSFLDHNIGRVLNALEASGAAADTVVLSISDHGEMLGDHGFWCKSVMYENSVGIPLIMAGSGIPAGINHTPVSLTDVKATVESLAGLEPEKTAEPWQSRPLQGFIDNPEADRFILSEYHDCGSPTGFFMIRQGPWKYVHYAGGYEPQLFNLQTDPTEVSDLAASPAHQSVRARLYGHLTSILDPEAVNAKAFSEQAALLEEFGGRDAVMAMESFNHTPVGS